MKRAAAGLVTLTVIGPLYCVGTVIGFLWMSVYIGIRDGEAFGLTLNRWWNE